MARSDSIPRRTFQSFGQALRFFRKRNRMTQEELAARVGYSREQIGHLEKGRRKPDSTMVAALFVPSLNLQDDTDLSAQFLQLAEIARKESTVAESHSVAGPDTSIGSTQGQEGINGDSRAAHRQAAADAEFARGDIMEAARQYYLARDFKEAADVLMDQGSLLANQGRWLEAAALIDQILVGLHEQPRISNRADIERRLLAIRGDVLIHTVRAEEAESNYREAIAQATGAVRTTLIYRLSVSLTQRGRAPEALDIIQRAYADLLPEHLLIRAQLKIVEGGALMALGRLDDAERANLEGLELSNQLLLAMPLLVANIRARANNSLGAINAIRQRPAEALVYWRAAVDTARLAGFRALEFRCQGNIANLLYEMGRLQEATVDCEAAIDGLKSIGDLHAAAQFIHLSANLRFAHGDIQPSLERIEEACDIKEKLGDWRSLLISRNQGVRALLALGRYGDAKTIFDESWPQLDQLGDTRLRGYWLMTFSEWQMLSGELEGARDSVKEATTLPGVVGDVKLQNDCANHLAVALMAMGDVKAAELTFASVSDGLEIPEIGLERELIRSVLAWVHGDRTSADKLICQVTSRARDCGFLIFERRAHQLSEVLTQLPECSMLPSLIYGKIVNV